MEFIEKNFILTTGSIVVDSNTSSAKNLLDWDLRRQYSSDGFADDTTSTTLTINFNDTQTVDRIALVSHNLKSFQIYYDGVTANTFAMSATANTTSANYSSNNDTSNYLTVTPQACTSVSIQLNSTQIADNEKAIGVIVLSSLKLDFTRIPNASGYKPALVPKQVIHKMSDGGRRAHRTADKWQVGLSFEDITATQRDSFREIYDTNDSYIYVPFGTSGSWDGVIFDAVWESGFEFYQHAGNATSEGFKGKIKLRERS